MTLPADRPVALSAAARLAADADNVAIALSTLPAGQTGGAPGPASSLFGGVRRAVRERRHIRRHSGSLPLRFVRHPGAGRNPGCDSHRN